MILREYQQKMISNLAKSLKENKHIVGQLATGGGKTVIFSSICQRYLSNNEQSILILVHRKELLVQTRNTLFVMHGISATIITAGTKYIPPSKVYVAMVESAHRRVERISNIGLVIIDECHIATFNKMLTHFENQYIIGFTATPISSNKKIPLNVYYKDIVCGVDIPELISQEYLCQNITRAPKVLIDRSKLKVKGSDFDDKIMSETFSRSKYVSNTIDAYKKWALHTKTIIFNVDIVHSIKVRDAFVESGFHCKHFDGTTPKEQRSQILKWFKNTPNAILCNVGLLTTGFDEPTIQNVIINKATMSMPLWLQMCGRGGRIIDDNFIDQKQHEYEYQLFYKKHFGIIDMGANALTHGDWCDSRNWNQVFHNPPKTKGEGIAPMKICPKCQGMVYASTKLCALHDEWGEVCGYVWPVKEISEEELLDTFIVITKNINAKSIVLQNKENKEYYSFFRIGTLLAIEAKNIYKDKFKNEYVKFVLQQYYEKGKEWARVITQKRMDEWNGITEKPKKMIFSQWHKKKAKEHLYIQLKGYYPQWEPQT